MEPLARPRPWKLWAADEGQDQTEKRRRSSPHEDMVRFAVSNTYRRLLDHGAVRPAAAETADVRRERAQAAAAHPHSRTPPFAPPIRELSFPGPVTVQVPGRGRGLWGEAWSCEARVVSPVLRGACGARRLPGPGDRGAAWAGRWARGRGRRAAGSTGQVSQLLRSTLFGRAAKPPTKSLRRPSGRKPGGQQGHPGHRLEQAAEPDEVITHVPERCWGCGADL